MKVNDKMTPSLKKLEKNLQTVPKKAYNYWVSKTPKRSGNARRRTSLKDSTIVADYGYAQRLDQGWSSQARNGMSKPTIDFVKKLIKSMMRK